MCHFVHSTPLIQPELRQTSLDSEIVPFSTWSGYTVLATGNAYCVPMLIPCQGDKSAANECKTRLEYSAVARFHRRIRKTNRIP